MWHACSAYRLVHMQNREAHGLRLLRVASISSAFVDSALKFFLVTASTNSISFFS